MTSISGRLRLGVAALAGTLLLVGCGSQQPGAAVFIGKSRIPVAQLTERVERSLADPAAKQKLGADRPAFERRQLSQLIDHQLIETAAKDQGVTVSEGDVDNRLRQYAEQAGGRKQLEQQAAQNGIAPADLRGFVRDLVLTDAIADKLVADVPVPAKQLQSAYAANREEYDQVRTAHVLVKDKATADRILATVKADPSSFAEQARRYSTDTSNKDKGGELPPTGRAGFVKEFSDAVFSARPGSFLEVRTQYGWHVVHVLEHRTTTLAEATPDLRRQALREEMGKRVQQLLADTARRLGVRVSPRFGRWNPKTLQVDPPENSLSSPAPGGGSSPGGGGGTPSATPGG